MDNEKSMKIADIIVRKLRKIERWFNNQQVASIYSASLLFSADTAKSLDDINDENVKIKIVDLAHFVPMKHIGCEGFSKGVTNLIRLFRQAKEKVKTMSPCCSSTGSHDSKAMAAAMMESA